MHPLEEVLEKYTLRATCVDDHIRLVQAKPLTSSVPLAQRGELLSSAFHGIIRQNKYGESSAQQPMKGRLPESVADAWVYTGHVYTLMKKDFIIAFFYDLSTARVTEIGDKTLEGLREKVENREFAYRLFNGTIPSELRA